MPHSGVYSERLLLAAAAGDWTTWTCPAGMRAVIKSVILTNNTATAATIGVYAAGFPLYQGSVQGFSSSVSPTMTLALYAGEQLSAHTPSPSTPCFVGGFLFSDDSGRTAAPGELSVTPYPPPGLVLSEDAEELLGDDTGPTGF